MTDTERELALQQALDGELDASELPADMQDELAATRRVVASLRALPAADLPAGFEARLRRHLHQAAAARPARGLGWRSPWLYGGVAAAFLVIAAGVGLVAVRPSASGAKSAAVARIAAPFHAPLIGSAGSAGSASGGAASFAAQSAAPSAATYAAAAPAPAASPIDVSQRKIIENASITVEVADVNAAFQRVGDLATKAGGYIAGSDLSRQDGSLHASVTARVPSGGLAGFTQSVAALGTVISQGQSSNDVTQQYIDLNGRLQALQAERTAYLGLLSKASNVADALKVQQALTDVEAQIESLTTQIQSLDRLSSLATVNVMLEPLSAQPSLSGNGGPFGKRLGSALANSWRVLAAAGSALVVAVVWALPWLVLLAVISGALFWFAHRRRGPPAA